MGGARWVDTDWKAHASATSWKSQQQIFNQTGRIDPDLDPSKIKYREARDSEANPESTPIILCCDCTGSMGYLAEQIIKHDLCDCTGSMGYLAEQIIKHDLGEVMKALYERQPVTDPAIMTMSVGDANGDQAPLQVSQFESAVGPAVDQLQKMWLEGNGGGNGGETYALAWAFAAYKTKVDSIKKRAHKGYLFTIGDECCHPKLLREHVRQFLDPPAEADMDARLLLAEVQKDWHVFHLIVQPHSGQPVLSSWRELLGERAIQVHDHTKLAAGIVSIIQVIEGQRVEDVNAGWDGGEAIVVRQVTAQLVKA